MDIANNKQKNNKPMEEAPDAVQISRLNKQVIKLNEMLERVRFQDYMEHLNNPRKMLFKSFLSGLSRGFGTAIGFTVLGAILIQLLTALANNNIPIISKFIAEIIRTVENYL